MVEPLRHRQTKGAETDMPGLQPLRHTPRLYHGLHLPRAPRRGDLPLQRRHAPDRLSSAATSCSASEEDAIEAAQPFGKECPKIGIGGDTSRSHPSHTTRHTGRVPGGSTRLSWAQRAKVGIPTRYGMLCRKDAILVVYRRSANDPSQGWLEDETNVDHIKHLERGLRCL
jgi:hypothetical protein